MNSVSVPKVNRGHDSLICILSNGCPENRIDVARLENYFRQNNLTLTDDYSIADIILFNTCGLTQNSENRSIAIIDDINSRKKAEAQLIVSGCLVNINQKRWLQHHRGPIIGKEDDMSILSELCGSSLDINNFEANHLVPHFKGPKRSSSRLKPLISQIFGSTGLGYTIPLSIMKQIKSRKNKRFNVIDRDTFYIKTSTGCANSCTYCGVKLSRGTIKSKSIDQVLGEINKGLGSGFRKFSLIGTDLGSYGRDLGCNLIDLCREIQTVPEAIELRLRNIHPGFLIQNLTGFLEILAKNNITYFSSAVQSGNNRILSLMKRGYRVEDYIHAISTIKKEYPQLKVRTQLMVGFPTEEDEEFMDTLRLLDKVKFDFVEVYLFEPRPGTEADRMDNKVPLEVAWSRYYRLYKKTLFH